jgi:hypothetical protein
LVFTAQFAQTRRRVIGERAVRIEAVVNLFRERIKRWVGRECHREPRRSFAIRVKKTTQRASCSGNACDIAQLGGPKDAAHAQPRD